VPYKNIDALLEDAPLFFVVHAATYDRSFSPVVLARLGVGQDLNGELARGGDDNGARVVHGRLAAP